MKKRHYIAFTISVILILILWIFWSIYSFSFFNYIFNENNEINAGTWGDSFGVINSLFGALGFIAVATTLILQGQSINHQNKYQNTQQFESTFFELLKLLRELRDEFRFVHSVDYRNTKNIERTVHTGLDAFNHAIIELRSSLERIDSADINKERIMEIYGKVVSNRFKTPLSPYCRILYNIIKMIKNEENLNEKEKIKYSNILRSQITNREIEICALNALEKSANDFRDLLIYARMFKYIPPSKLRRVLKKIYPPEAFMGRD